MTTVKVTTVKFGKYGTCPKCDIGVLQGSDLIHRREGDEQMSTQFIRCTRCDYITQHVTQRTLPAELLERERYWEKWKKDWDAKHGIETGE